jgi:hypothetical protein
MSKVALDTARERLLDQVFAARTLPQIAAAKQALRDWLAEHPDEPGMADAFEVLSHQEDFARGEVDASGKPETTKVCGDTTRDRLLEQVFAARTLVEIAAAKQAVRDWLAAHPDEPEMADALEVLSHQEQLLRAQEVGPGAPAHPAAAT